MGFPGLLLNVFVEALIYIRYFDHISYLVVECDPSFCYATHFSLPFGVSKCDVSLIYSNVRVGILCVYFLFEITNY